MSDTYHDQGPDESDDKFQMWTCQPAGKDFCLPTAQMYKLYNGICRQQLLWGIREKKTSLRKHDSDYSEDPQLFCSFEGLLTCFAFRLKTRSCLPITLQHFFNFLVICSGWRLLIERSQACVVNAKPAMLRKTLDSDALPYQAKASRPIHFTCSTENQRYPA
jgi:hypothetical protein